MRPHPIGQITGVYEDPRYAGGQQKLEPIIQQRPSGDRHQAFGQGIGYRAKPCPQPAG